MAKRSGKAKARAAAGGAARAGGLEVEVFPPGTLTLDGVDLSAEVGEGEYEERVAELQERAFALQIEGFQRGERTVVAFEGWDAAGKGGCIKRLTALMDPRGYKVWPIAAPRDEDARHHWLWRFWRRLPEAGELTVFDRTWYGRVLVERVEGFARAEAWRRAYDEINAFERTLTADGVRLVKIFLHIDRAEQKRRFEEREEDPLKRYKIGPDDWRNRKRWPDYERAIQEMLDRTHRPDAPWVLVAANSKRHARLEVLRTVIAAMS
ncbi:MAG: polyphosphate kinase [Anaeromyxobacteraceae bacterium]|nr:polyphosphate kinase [Anaeromyxobacteraceae bacterium]